MSKNNKPAPLPKRGQDGSQPTAIGPQLDMRHGYQPTSKFSPKKPPSNPPNKGSSGKK